MRIFLFTLLIIAISFPCLAQENDKINFKGFADSYHAFRIKSPHEFLASRSRFRGEIEMVNGNSYFFVSINAVHNNVLPELTKIQFREAYLEFTGRKWGFKAGRQIIIWGKADGLKITDIISPMDLTEFLAQDYDDIRMPVNGIVLSKYNKNWDMEFICIPVFESYLLPGTDNPWGTDFAGQGLIEDEAIIPAMKLSNVEYGGKLSFYLPGIDLDISALHTWNKAPVYSYKVDSSEGSLHIRPEHHRLGFVGFGFSKSLHAFIIRGESAFYIDKKFSPKAERFLPGLLKSNSINYLVGVDWYPGREWTLTGQLSDEYILKYTDEYASGKHSFFTTLGLSKKILNSTLSISTFGYIGLNECDFFMHTSADYSLSDNIHIMTGYDWFYGDSGMFGRYNQNSQMWVKAKFSF